jgi:pimeloyl-ACP methyl ester carboxylesterase
MNMKRILLLVVSLFLSLSFMACGNNGSKSGPIATDYSIAEHWLSIPATVNAVDVFYLYPTEYNKINPTDPNICEIDNASMLAGSASAFARQATAFETIANIYAPYYRQADAAYALNLPPAEHEIVIGGIPTLDATAAFDYYIRHFNNGRPFILAGHSQGSDVMMNILADYMEDNPDVYDRMIAAYVIGYSVTQTYLDDNPHLIFATGPDDTGVIISYNTEAPVVPDGNPVVVGIPIAINPITWTRSETLATVGEGLGSFMPDPVTGIFSQVPQYADARVDTAKGVVICTTAVESDLNMGLGPGVFHSYDYPFYYFNIRENATNRVNRYLTP